LNEHIQNKKLYVTFGNGEYMFNVTNKITSKYVNNGKLIIPPSFNNDVDFKQISTILNNFPGILHIYINSVMYVVGRDTNEVTELFIDNIYDIDAHYGCDDFRIDVTNKFINTFIKGDRITISRNYHFNKCFGDVCPGVYKKLYLRNGNTNLVLNENVYLDIDVAAVKI
jgi:hypothetical protein